MCSTPTPLVDVQFEVVDARSVEAVEAMRRYFAELDDLFDGGFEPGDTLTADAGLFDPPGGAFVVIRVDDVVVGCGGALTIEPGVGEVKRMWIDAAHRGQGLATQMLEQLEGHLRAAGNDIVRLDTNAALSAAIKMYERLGYRPVDRYNDNPYAHHWFEKHLGVKVG